MIGLDSVKRSLDEIPSLLAINAERKAEGLLESKLSLHAVFVGNPGTVWVDCYGVIDTPRFSAGTNSRASAARAVGT
jgi:hypothetical protein